MCVFIHFLLLFLCFPFKKLLNWLERNSFNIFSSQAARRWPKKNVIFHAGNENSVTEKKIRSMFAIRNWRVPFIILTNVFSLCFCLRFSFCTDGTFVHIYVSYSISFIHVFAIRFCLFVVAWNSPQFI